MAVTIWLTECEFTLAGPIIDPLWADCCLSFLWGLAILLRIICQCGSGVEQRLPHRRLGGWTNIPLSENQWWHLSADEDCAVGQVLAERKFNDFPFTI
ncbi:hypothetical protein [Mesorhizobium sp. CAU 1741]|uniref:hypothetical protein n=1 Tax=Mesorhizobium sp. CAU 1741 TaxID=3140366 RepID=UPI00325AD4C0